MRNQVRVEKDIRGSLSKVRNQTQCFDKVKHTRRLESRVSVWTVRSSSSKIPTMSSNMHKFRLPSSPNTFCMWLCVAHPAATKDRANANDRSQVIKPTTNVDPSSKQIRHGPNRGFHDGQRVRVQYKEYEFNPKSTSSIVRCGPR